jgi:futalosine hydrolase
MRLLIVTAVQAEADAIGSPRPSEATVIAGGIGRTNAAAATTEAILRARAERNPFDAVLSAGIAGALPGGSLTLGQAVVASACVYVEEGIVTARGFADMAGLGLALGDFESNVVPVDPQLLEALSAQFTIGPIATVATCSGTDAAAAEVVRRTGAIAEAMEGAAVVHASRRLNVPAIELRVISNTCGDRARQTWDITTALRNLGEAVARATALLQRQD